MYRAQSSPVVTDSVLKITSDEPFSLLLLFPCCTVFGYSTSKPPNLVFVSCSAWSRSQPATRRNDLAWLLQWVTALRRRPCPPPSCPHPAPLTSTPPPLPLFDATEGRSSIPPFWLTGIYCLPLMAKSYLADAPPFKPPEVLPLLPLPTCTVQELLL